MRGFAVNDKLCFPRKATLLVSSLGNQSWTSRKPICRNLRFQKGHARFSKNTSTDFLSAEARLQMLAINHSLSLAFVNKFCTFVWVSPELVGALWPSCHKTAPVFQEMRFSAAFFRLAFSALMGQTWSGKVLQALWKIWVRAQHLRRKTIVLYADSEILLYEL